jgi:hypothetical protein
MGNALNKSAENLARVRERIEQAASRAGRQSQEITLIAVSKMHSAAQIRELYDAGVRHFGENRVQEWESKRAQLTDLHAGWHMIGHLQSNKATRTVRLFDSVDSVDSAALAERLDRAKNDFNAECTEGAEDSEKIRKEKQQTVAHGKTRLRILVEVMLDPGGTKSGVGREELPTLLESVLRLPHLDLRGLMGVPPFFEDAETARPYFRRLRELRDSIRARLGNDVLPVLSMGMSHDFEVAIEEGATEIRVGTALFGPREKA